MGDRSDETTNQYLAKLNRRTFADPALGERVSWLADLVDLLLSEKTADWRVLRTPYFSSAFVVGLLL